MFSSLVCILLSASGVSFAGSLERKKNKKPLFIVLWDVAEKPADNKYSRDKIHKILF